MGGAVASVTASTGNVATAEVSFADGDLGPNASCSLEMSSDLKIPMGTGEILWALEAGSVTVVWTHHTFLEIGRPTNPSEPYFAIEENETSGQDEVGTAIANSTTMDPESKLRAYGLQAPNVEAIRVDGEIAIAPASEDEMTSDEAWNSDLPANAIQVVSKSAIWADGNFSVRVWNATVTIRNATGEHSYRSGNWTEGIGPSGPGQPHMVRHRHYQTVRLDVRDAELVLSPSQRESRIVAQRVKCVGDFPASLRQVTGLIEYDGGEASVQEAEWGVNNVTAFEAWNETAKGMARFEAPAAAFGLQSPEKPPTNPPDGAPRTALPVRTSPTEMGAGFLAFLAVAGFALLVNRRRRPVDNRQIEWALLSGQPGKAARMAKHRLRSTPDDADTVFLYGASLLVRGLVDDVVRRVEPLVIRLPDDQRHGHAYLLALSHRARDEAASARWAREASSEPLLLRELERSGMLRSGPNSSTGPATDFGAAYV